MRSRSLPRSVALCRSRRTRAARLSLRSSFVLDSAGAIGFAFRQRVYQRLAAGMLPATFWRRRVKVYMGGPMFVLAEVEYNLRLAAKLRSLGFDVYCPNE